MHMFARKDSQYSMEAIIVMVLVSYSKILRLESTMSRDIGSESGRKLVWSLKLYQLSRSVWSFPCSTSWVTCLGLTSPRPMYNNMHMEYCQARNSHEPWCPGISIRAWLLKHGRQSVGWYLGTCIPHHGLLVWPKAHIDSKTLVSGRTFQEFRDYLPGAKTKVRPSFE